MTHAKHLSVVVWVVCVLLLSNAGIGYAQETDGANTVYLPLVSSIEGGENIAASPQPSEPIPGQYIVVLRDDLVASASVSAIAAEMATTYGGELLQTYDAALNGFAVKFAEARSADAVSSLLKDERVELVEQDSTVSIADETAADTTQTGAPWGLDRIDQRARPLNGNFNYAKTGKGVNVYIIDTGIRTTHAQFGTRASSGYDAIDKALPADDCNGHGTHVAGTVGGSTYGVAKEVTLIAVRVLNCSGSGSNSQVIAGIDWVTKNRVKPAVANMSLGGSASSVLDAAVQKSINAGVTYAIAAGNSNANACNYSPARVGAAITVGATTSADARASYSNWGTCLDLFAPGSSIISAWYTSNTATNTISGTSMATPHVAGVAALYLQGSPSASPATVANALINNATTNVVGSRGTGSPNRLLFTNY